MVNGSAGSAAELHQGDLFQQDLFQEDQPLELKVEEPAAFFEEQKEHSDQKGEEVENERDDEEEKEEEIPKTQEEEKMKPDPLDDLYTSLASADMFNNVSAFTKPQESTVRVIHELKPNHQSFNRWR